MAWSLEFSVYGRAHQIIEVSSSGAMQTPSRATESPPIATLCDLYWAQRPVVGNTRRDPHNPRIRHRSSMRWRSGHRNDTTSKRTRTAGNSRPGIGIAVPYVTLVAGRNRRLSTPNEKNARRQVRLTGRAPRHPSATRPGSVLSGCSERLEEPCATSPAHTHSHSVQSMGTAPRRPAISDNVDYVALRSPNPALRHNM